MARRLMTALAAVAVAFSLLPASADSGHRDVIPLLANAGNRYVPAPPGTVQDLSYVFGPYVIPPGQDSNRITVDLPLTTGFIVAIAPDLVDVSTGEIPTQQEAHIHHAHWFRVSEDSKNDYYTSVQGKGLSWVFGTGEEKTQGRLDDRARLDKAAGNDWEYGIPISGSEPNTMIYMIHNKLATVGNYFVVLDVTFIPGTREEILAATNRDIHPLNSQLWGRTKDVTGSSKEIGARWKVTRDGVGIASGGHLHPGGKMTVISNLGKDATCTADLDGDGFPGVAILRSYKFDRDMRAWPFTENYQIGATKFGWRAPLHKGDVLEQFATYAIEPTGTPELNNFVSNDSLPHNWYEAMTYTGIYYDSYQVPGTPAGVCSLAALAPRLLGNDTFEEQGLSSSWLDGDGLVKPELAAGVAEIEDDWNRFGTGAAEGMVNHIWQGEAEPLCAQENMPALAGIYPACGPDDIATELGPEVSEIHVAGFLYVPGDLGFGDVPTLPAVKQGSTITFVNDDAAINVRHTFTSCRWPCVGPYVSNFPLPSGGAHAFDTGKIGNIDPIDGGAEVEKVLLGQENDTVPFYEFKADLPAGRYSYFCRIHPFMRGGFEVVT
ncbi:MAG TPA: hypothetical protein VM841_05230 [Actinomycetota bacterium]|nr:hypothetical protein [Actinomycetota bacterium]